MEKKGKGRWLPRRFQLLSGASQILLAPFGASQDGRSQSSHSTLPATRSLLGNAESSNGIHSMRWLSPQWGISREDRMAVKKATRSNILSTLVQVLCHCMVTVEATVVHVHHSKSS